jgi:hypothetical protein
MWADIARHYSLNPDLTDITGYSMGGGGTYRLATRWPDLFARAFPIVGPPTSAATFTSLRNIPVMAWYGQNDELVGPEMSEQTFLDASQAGIRYDHWIFTPAGHITEGNNDEYTPAANFFGDHTVDRNPMHVTYVFNPSEDPKALSPTDHAYWASGMKLASGASTGTVDAKSHGFGVGDPPVEPVKLGASTLNGGSHGPIPYQERTIDWGKAPATPPANELDIDTTGLSALTIDTLRADVGCAPKLNVTSDVPVKIALGGCDLVASAAKGRSTLRVCASRRSFVIHLARRLHGRRVVRATVRVGSAKARTVRGKRLALRISLRGRPASRVRVRIVSRLSNGRRVTTVRTYLTCARRR